MPTRSMHRVARRDFLAVVAYAVSLLFASVSFAFHPGVVPPFRTGHYQRARESFLPLHDTTGNNMESSSSLKVSPDVDFQSLLIMDVVLFQRQQSDSATKLELGAVQENGNVAPLSTWTLESAYTSDTDDMMEFVADEEDMFPGLSSDEIRVVKVVDESAMSYGSRQVGGGKGPGNPHGEESELLYYLHRDVVEGVYEGCGDGAEMGMTVTVVVNPDLEILW